MSRLCCATGIRDLYEEDETAKCLPYKLSTQGKLYWLFLKKAFAWRILATLITTLVAAVVTRDFKQASKIGGIEMAIKFIVYIAHEQIWESAHEKVCVEITTEKNQQQQDLPDSPPSNQPASARNPLQQTETVLLFA